MYPSQCRTFANDFYPRSPCGERHRRRLMPKRGHWISIHALLAESDHIRSTSHDRPVISIHALLAESDFQPQHRYYNSGHFYPRSPCGERLDDLQVPASVSKISIHALLAESDPRCYDHRPDVGYFYPRSPCGERRVKNHQGAFRHHFYPRSPCGERH